MANTCSLRSPMRPCKRSQRWSKMKIRPLEHRMSLRPVPLITILHWPTSERSNPRWRLRESNSYKIRSPVMLNVPMVTTDLHGHHIWPAKMKIIMIPTSWSPMALQGEKLRTKMVKRPIMKVAAVTQMSLRCRSKS